MDSELLLKGVAEISGDQVTLKQLIELAHQLETASAKVAALAHCVKDGAVFKLEQNGVKSARDHAFLAYALDVMQDAGKVIEETAKAALKGSDDKRGSYGLAQRFAELLREQGVTNMKFDGLGTFYISSQPVAYPPPKTDAPKYEAFRKWCVEQGLTTESYQWQKFQGLVKAMLEESAKVSIGSPTDVIPEFITVQLREEVRLRR